MGMLNDQLYMSAHAHGPGKDDQRQPLPDDSHWRAVLVTLNLDGMQQRSRLAGSKCRTHGDLWVHGAASCTAPHVYQLISHWQAEGRQACMPIEHLSPNGSCVHGSFVHTQCPSCIGDEENDAAGEHCPELST